MKIYIVANGLPKNEETVIYLKMSGLAKSSKIRRKNDAFLQHSNVSMSQELHNTRINHDLIT